MDINDLVKIINDSTAKANIELSSIPNIALYMEQVLTFLNDELEDYQRDNKDKIYTKSMINNYVKSQVMKKPDNKKYTPEHVIELLLIFYLKQMLSLEDIKVLFDFCFTDKNTKEIYNSYLKYTDSDFLDIASEIKSYIQTIDNDNELDTENKKMIILIGLLSAKANAYKMFSEKLIDTLKNNKKRE